MSSLLLLCQNLQEYADWRCIFNALAEEMPFSLRLLPTWRLDGDRPFEANFHPAVDVKVLPLDCKQGVIFKNLPSRDKIALLKSVKPDLDAALAGVDLICSGVQTVFVRYLYCRREAGQTFVTLLRSLLLPTREDRVVAARRRLLRVLAAAMGRGFMAAPPAGVGYTDYYLTIGELNRRYLLGHGVDAERIRLVGAPSLDCLRASPRRWGGPLRVYLLAQAFSLHGLAAVEQEQDDLFRRLVAAWQADGSLKSRLELHVKAHPRDRSGRYDWLKDSPVQVHHQNMSVADLAAAADLAVATTSTLAFELLAAGVPALFAAPPTTRAAYAAWFEAIGVSPLSSVEAIFEQLRRVAADHEPPSLTPQMRQIVDSVFHKSGSGSAARSGKDAMLAIMRGPSVEYEGAEAAR